MRWATVAVVVVVAATMALLIRPPIKDPALAHELISMQRDIDQFSLRFNSAGPVNIGDLSEALKKKIRNADEVDKANADRLAEILATHGWPTEREVGKEAAFAAMNVVGRAQDVDFKVKAVALMDKAGVERNPQYARLVDMVAVIKGQPQTYGTQWNCENGTYKYMTPLKDPAHIRRLRQDVGLPPSDAFRNDFCAEPGANGAVQIRRR
ncbi:MAG: hypothetical protein QOG90_1114 [Actinomycetota bacterium]|jgi:hypothetical protein